MMAILNSYQRARILVLSACILCFVLFWFGGSYTRIPLERGSHASASLIQQSSPLITWPLVILFFVAAALVGTAISGMIRFNAGLVAACVGLGALSLRGGSSRATIFRALAHDAVPRVFLLLAVETAILAILIGIIWVVLRRLYEMGKIKDRESADMLEEDLFPDRDALASLAIQTIVTCICILLIARTAAKQQVIAAVFIASLLGPMAVQWLYPARLRGWHWLPPLLVGIVGYIAAWYDPTGAQIGDLNGTFAALARPLPLDYASAGPAGAIIGQWIAHRWQRQRELDGKPATA